eukprot:gene3724-7400_t
MGRLRRIELENFKSYFGHQIIGPFDDFTAIIGPNGAGKSNMMDAISFVLGVQSRHLRSSHLKELIFRKDADSPPARRAIVKLVYEVSDGEVDGRQSGREIHFSRNISATGVSTYRLDDKEVTYEAYENLLQKIGVLVKARNFLVFQGDVESVASKSPQELTKLLEQICGSDQLRNEYEELLQKKSESEESTIFSIQKKKMYLTQKREIKEQKDEAEIFRQKKEELENLKTEHILRQIFRLKIGINQRQLQLESFRQEIEEKKSKEDEFDQSIQTQKSSLSHLNKEVTNIEKENLINEKNLSKLNINYNEINEKLKSLSKRISDINIKITTHKKDLTDRNSNMEALQREIELLEQSKVEVEEELRKLNNSNILSLDVNKLKEYSILREEVASKSSILRTEEITLENELKGIKSRLEHISIQNNSLENENTNNMELYNEYSNRIKKLSSCITLYTDEKKNIEFSKNELNAQLIESGTKIQTLSEELVVLNERLRDAGEDRRRNEQEEKVLEAIETMKRIFNGVHGKLIDLCKPIQKKYSQAVTVAAGKNMDAIVVDSRQVAIECINYLKEHRVGVCSFLPLDNITPHAPPERLRHLGPKYRLCIDLVESDEIIKPAVLHAVGSTVVCDTLEDAQELCFHVGERVKAVTLTGHVISKSGTMTGGSSAGTGRGGGGDRWEEKDLMRMRKRRGEVETELSDANRNAPSRNKLEEYTCRLKVLEDQLRNCVSDKKVNEEKLVQNKKQTELRNTKLNALNKEANDLKEQETSLTEKLENLHESINTIEYKIFKNFSKSLGVKNIREYEIQQKKEYDAIISKKTSILDKIIALKSQLEYQEKRDISNVLERCNKQKETAEKELNKLIQEESKVQSDIDKLKDRLHEKDSEGNDKLKQLLKEKSNTATKVRELQLQRVKLTHEKDSVCKRLAGEEILLEKGRAELHEVMEKALVDEISLPTVPILTIENKNTNTTTSTDKKKRGNKKLSTSSVSSDSNNNSDSSSSNMIGEDEIDRDIDNNDKNNNTHTPSHLISDDDRMMLWLGPRTADSASQHHHHTGGEEGGGGGGGSHRESTDTSASGSGTGSGTGSDSMRLSKTSGVSTAHSAHYSQSDNPVVVSDRNAAAKVDLSSLDRFKNIPQQQLLQTEHDLSRQIALLQAEVEVINPNMHAIERYENVIEKLREVENELIIAKDAAKDIQSRFESIRAQRMELFQECYKHVSEALGVIYKDLTRSSKHPLGGNAYLTLDNTEEPYLGGMRYTAMPPMKRFRNMDQLSGGEKTVAALALLFSIHSFRQAPFFVLDEVDAALDNVNVKKVCNYIRQRSKDFQCVVISLKDMFFEHADALVGVYKDINTLSSKVLTLNLNQYDSNNNNTQQQHQLEEHIQHQHQLDEREETGVETGAPRITAPMSEEKNSATANRRGATRTNITSKNDETDGGIPSKRTSSSTSTKKTATRKPSATPTKLTKRVSGRKRPQSIIEESEEEDEDEED